MGMHPVFHSMPSSMLTFIGYVSLEGILTNSTRQWCPGSLILLSFGTVTTGFSPDLYRDDNRPGCPLHVTTFWAVWKELGISCP